MSLDLSKIAGINKHETTYLYDEIFVRRGYSPQGLTLPADAVVFDVGANIGMYSMFVNTVCPAATIYAFEPLPPIFEKLTANTGAYANLMPYGLSNTERAVDFTYYPGYSTMSVQVSYADTVAEKKLVRQRFIADEEPTGEVLEQLDDMLDFRFRETTHHCRLRRLSDVVDEHNVPVIDVLKIDVQRAELDVLAGIDERHWPLVQQIVMEVHDEPETPTEGRLDLVTTLLEKHGFRVVTEQEDRFAGTDRHSLYAFSNRSD
jgi:FkbM family methyltransferase